jgi:hypothetical protein
MNIKSANGVTGFILYSGDGRSFFRVYGENLTFKDYALLHSDLEVTITDPDAFFYEGEHTDRMNCLDHSPATLGFPNGKN